MIGGAIFPHEKYSKTTWISPDGRTQNQIDYFAISRRWRSSLQDERVDTGSNHHLIAAEVTIKLFACKRPYSVRHRFDGHKETIDRPIVDNTGSLLTKRNGQLDEWRDHFGTVPVVVSHGATG